jgi:hypothetical protein
MPPSIKKAGGINNVTPEERATLFERTANYRHGYDEGKSAGVWIGRLQVLSAVMFLAAILAVAHYLF